MQRADAGIAAPRENELCRTAAANHLVVEQIGRHAHERQVGYPLTDDLVPGGKRNQVSEAFERDCLPWPHVACDGVSKGRELTHASKGAPV